MSKFTQNASTIRAAGRAAFTCGVALLLGACAMEGVAEERDMGATESDVASSVSELRGPFMIAGAQYVDGSTLVDVSIGETLELVATVRCMPGERAVLEVSAPGSEQYGALPAPEGMASCDLQATASLATQVARDVLRQDSGVEAYDGAGCDVVGGSSSCCATHDACYAAYSCTAWSWFTTPWGGTPCRRCNQEVVECLL